MAAVGHLGYGKLPFSSRDLYLQVINNTTICKAHSVSIRAESEAPKRDSSSPLQFRFNQPM